MPERCSLHCILPPHVLDHMAKSEDADVREIAVRAIELSSGARATREAFALMPRLAALSPVAAAQTKNRAIFDMRKRTSRLPGRLVRGEHGPATADAAVNEAFDYSGDTYDFYDQVFGRNSLDNNGMTLVSSVHYGNKYNNAFWNGAQMVYGDGDGKIFTRFTKSLDVVGHELSHGVVSHECNLEYQDESGALNEHFADTFGLMIKQRKLNLDVTASDWRIGTEIMGPGTTAKSIRTFKNEPAYQNDPALGTDPQPKHMRDKYMGEEDNGGVHINSGIPNHAFYLLATSLGGQAWTRAGKIWYGALRALNQTSNFQQMTDMTYAIAGQLYGAGSIEQKAVKDAWAAVGLNISQPAIGRSA